MPEICRPWWCIWSERWPDFEFIDDKAVGGLVCRHVNTVTWVLTPDRLAQRRFVSKMIQALVCHVILRLFFIPSTIRYNLHGIEKLNQYDKNKIFIRVELCEDVIFNSFAIIRQETNLDIFFFSIERQHHGII